MENRKPEDPSFSTILFFIFRNLILPIQSQFSEQVLSQSRRRAVYKDVLVKKFFVFTVFLTDASQQYDLHMILYFSLLLQTGNDCVACVASVTEACLTLPRKPLGSVFDIGGVQDLLLLKCETMFLSLECNTFLRVLLVVVEFSLA